MYFKRIEIQGFKSFADPVSIELNDGITCVVGPNGSGKSNISDAFRWVIGEQSSRQLRGNKMQDVIFAGTETRKPKGLAEVSLVIDNSTSILPLEYNEVIVTRKMYRDGESEYLINGNQCRLRDIRELFMDTGIGVEGYSIIGQGKISDIVSTKPENRRQIFEEAAGVVLYKTRKAEAESKLKAATDDISRVRDIIAEIESRIEGLESDSVKATEYIELREKYRHLGINIILHNLENLKKTVDDGKFILTEMGESISVLEEDSISIEEKLDELSELEASYILESEELNKKLLAVINELNDTTSGGKINIEKLSNIEKEIERISDEIDVAREKLKAENEVYSALLEKERELVESKEKNNIELQQKVLVFNEHTQELTQNKKILNDTDNRINDFNNRIIRSKSEIKTLSNYKEMLKERLEKLNQEHVGRGTTGQENKSRLDSILTKISSTENELQNEKKILEDLDKNIFNSDSEVKKIDALISDIDMSISKSETRKATIEEMEDNYEGYNNSVRFLMKQNITGIIGTVADIISVDNGFETAIETALGGNLQNIVCLDDNSAKRGIEYLKTSRGGRATFLPVESVTADIIEINDSIQSINGFMGIANSKVVHEKKYTDIIDYLLCRVIIADNMDNAIKLSKKSPKGFRIVTMEGEIINSSGAITGGKFANKSANLLDRKKEINYLKKEIEEKKKDLSDIKERKSQLLDDRGKTDNKRMHSASQIRALEIKLGEFRKDFDYIQKAIDDDNKEKEKFKSDLESIEKDILATGKRISECEVEIEKYTSEVKKEEESIIDMKAAIEKSKLIVEADNEEIVSLKIKIGEIDSRSLSQNELIERLRDTVTDLQSLIEEDTNAISTLNMEKERLKSIDVTSSERESELNATKEDLDKRIKEISLFIEDNKEKQADIKEKLKSDKNRIEKEKEEKNKLELKITRNETLLDAQKDKLWDEFELSYAEALTMKDNNFVFSTGNKNIREVRLRMTELGDVNIGAIEEYKQVKTRYDFMTSQEEDLKKAMDELQQIILNMDKTIKQKFKTNFDQVVINFEKSFKDLFGGGYAELRLEDESNPLESGIEITAQPPGKKLKNINLLSGGEKTLTAIALMFAVLNTKPTPFVILDEVEAALDEVNIERFSSYIRNFENIQFALITHQKATMEHADVLYGVTMPEQGISKVLSLKLGDKLNAKYTSV